MYIVIVYDINQKRVNKALKIARKYLSWIQNSVLEGEITKGKYQMFLKEMKNVINEQEDSLLVYELPTKKFLQRNEIGVQKGNPGQWIV